MKLKRERQSSILSFFSLFALFAVSLSAVAAGGNFWVRERNSPAARMEKSLFGPGSYPPRCSSKCSHCTPCRPVHVAVPPGTPVLTEYYPEAWRCKCGGRLYMP